MSYMDEYDKWEKEDNIIFALKRIKRKEEDYASMIKNGKDVYVIYGIENDGNIFFKLTEDMIDAFEDIFDNDFDYNVGLFTDLKVFDNGRINDWEDGNWYFYKKWNLERYDGTIKDYPEININNIYDIFKPYIRNKNK